MDVVLGTSIAVTTTRGAKLEGMVYAIDTQSRCLVLRAENDYTLVSLDQVANVTAGPSQFEESGLDKEHLHALSVERQQKYEEIQIKRVDEYYSHQGVGVTPEAQALYDELRKTLPVKWAPNEQAILLFNGDARLLPPYTVKDFRGDQTSIGQARKIVEHFNQTRGTAATPQQN